MVSGCWRPHTIRSTVRTVYVLPTILALLYALQDTTWTPVVVCFTTFCFFFNFSFWINGNNHFVLCQNLWGISLCTIIGASATSRGTKRGVYSINFFGSLLLRSKKFIVEGCVNFSPYKPFLSFFFFLCRVVSLCMSPINDSFMSGSLDHTIRLWDLRTNSCQVWSSVSLFCKNSFNWKVISFDPSTPYRQGPYFSYPGSFGKALVCRKWNKMLLIKQPVHLFICLFNFLLAAVEFWPLAMSSTFYSLR